MNIRYKEQLENDILYKSFFEAYKKDENIKDLLFKAGFFEEDRTEADTMLIKDDILLTMPINSPKTEKKLAVIISTGSYSPMHEGHIDKMIKSKELVESLGYEVLQGVLSLSHDKYVSFKNNGEAKNHISNRTQIAYEKIEEMGQEDWLKIDRFEGEIVSTNINFSTVIERNIALVENYLKREVTYFYVFGSDNAAFSYAFSSQNKFKGICVEREGFNQESFVKALNKNNLYYLKNENSIYRGYSSTKIRSNKVELKNKEKNIKKPVYLIRGNSVPEDFNVKLKEIFEKYFKEIEVRLYSTNEDYLKGYISLDKFVQGDINIETSRRFEISSFQRKAIDMKFFDIEKINLVPGEYKLIDDDSVSGYTIEKVKDFLKEKGITITEVNTIVQNYLGKNEFLYDVVDARDFYLAGFKSGLMVRTPNFESIRYPYIFPYVNLTTRANVKCEEQIDFSKDILLLNREMNKVGFDKYNGDFLLTVYNNFLSMEKK